MDLWNVFQWTTSEKKKQIENENAQNKNRNADQVGDLQGMLSFMSKMADIGSNGNEDADTSFRNSATAAVLLSQRVAAYGLETVEPVDEK